MAERFAHKKNCGFSLVETLAVVTIIVILLSISAVAAAYYRDYLKITELDNAAREIYMAAENRAVLLGGGGQLDKTLEDGAATLAEGGAESASVYVDEDGAASLGLLTAGAVDPALLDGKFYIVYDRASGAVTDVFYAEGTSIQDIDRAFELADQGRDARMRPGEGPMLGYYGGRQQARDPFTPLPAPEVIVEIENAERLTVKVTFIIPEEARKLMGGYNETALGANTRRTVTLAYPGMAPVTLLDSGSSLDPFRSRLISQTGTLSSGSLSYTWVLDELDTNSARDNGRHFHKIFNQAGAAYGLDFTVSAEITLSAEGRRPVSASGQDTDNSLFAARSGGDTARLENVRHLQNLDADTSHAGGKTAAVQLSDIDCYHAAPYPMYEFVPIVNGELRSFDGGWSAGEDARRNEILDLHVTEASAAGKDGAGLFARTADGESAANPVTFTGIRLMNAVVSASKPSGALAGTAGNNILFKDIQAVNAGVDGREAAGGVVGIAGHTGGSHSDTAVFETVRVVNSQISCSGGAAGGVAGRILGAAQTGDFEDCWVYWDATDQQDVRSLMLGNDYMYKGNDDAAYKISGGVAGGLVGELKKAGAPSTSAYIQNCLAATSVRAGQYAGGFIGRSESNTFISSSYTDCYLSGGDGAAGLTGLVLGGSSLGVTNAYTAGFTDMGSTQKAAGFCLGSAKAEAVNAYTVMCYSQQEEGTDYTGRIFQLTETQEAYNNDEFTRTYYINANYGHKSEGAPPASLGGSPGKQAQLATYPELSSAAGFIQNHGWEAGFGKKTAGSSFPYNLQEHLRLEIYEFPGLKGLPHYGDWSAEFSKPSLVYYEDYGTHIGFSGGNARYLTDEESKIGSLNNLTIRSDGYAIAFLKEDVKGGACSITYRYLDGSDPANPQWKTLSQDYSTAGLFSVKWGEKEYYLAPLPKQLVTGPLTSPDFFQYLYFSASNENGLNASGEGFYNPHFAEAVIPYASEDGSLFLQPSAAPAEAAGLVSKYVSGELIAKRTRGAVSIRTPRHFFHLSQFPDYYHNAKHRLTFQQELDLDGGEGVYTGYPGLLKHADGVQLQSRIGTEQAPFLGVYDGNRHMIRRLAFITDSAKDPALKEDFSLTAIGLFGHSNGTLRNIVYKLGDNPAVDAFFPSSQKDTYLGALVGRNGGVGVVENCAVEAVRLNLRAYTTAIYIGGLAGLNEGRIQGSAADCALIQVEGSNYATAYVGGLAGRNQGGLSISESYAVGRLSANADKTTAPVVLSGFAGRNSGNILRSYSAMDLQTDGAGAKAFGFCGKSEGGRQSNTFFLNKGNFSYRDQEFSANYDAGEGSAARSVTYKELTAAPSIVSGMAFIAKAGAFPYPAVVEGGSGLTHYGAWPAPLDLGEMGVYYWEERVTERGPEYNYTLLAVKPNQTISRISTLSRARDQGDTVTRWGYGYYNAENKPINTLTSENLLYSIGGGSETSIEDLFNQRQLAAQQVREVDEALAQWKNNAAGPGEPQFAFHSFRSFGMDKSLGGLYPDSTSAAPNAVLSLSQSGNVTVRFTLNPFFAEALSVEYPNGWGPEADASKGHTPPTAAPGSVNNHYGVRSIEQLELINWNRENRDVHTAIHKGAADAHAIASFPYLSSGSTTGKYYWTQSHDVTGVKGQTYTPIAEYYDSTNTNTPRGYLTGWFGGVYDGQGYTIKNVSINDFTEEEQAQRLSSCAGLFGVVYNGTLENIILYSSSGQNVVKSIFNQNSQSQWYAIGALAGVAASHDANGNPGQTAVKNCAVSGYQIQSKTFTNKLKDTWGGVGVGGLLGLSNMSLSGCTADTEISLMAGTVANDNLRVGGLVGSCQGSIENCYAGGSISVKTITLDSGKGIYIGGLVGGSYMKPLQIGGNTSLTMGFDEDTGNGGANDTKGWTNNTLRNCYSYVTLPEGGNQIKGLFAVGGAGEINAGNRPGTAKNHGVSVKENCYYLESEVLKHNSRDDLTAAAASSLRTDLTDNVYSVGQTYGEPDSRFEQAAGSVYVEGNPSSYYDNLYYMKCDSPRNGLRLFQKNAAGSYVFRGWLTNYSDGGTWYITADRSKSEPGVTGLSYEQLSGTEAVNAAGQTIYDLLPGFSPVDNTNRGDGIPVPGKYSYPPATRPDLQDRDYPFPTILTKEAEDGGKPYHVHYGGWPLNGFRRQRIQEGPPVYLGGSPIEIDLFAGKTYREYLVLTEDVHPGGTWTAELVSQAGTGSPPPIVQLQEVTPMSGKAKTYLLDLTALRNGSDDLRVSYTAPQTNTTYSLLVPVHVTSGVKLRPDRLFMFPSDTVELLVKAADRNGLPLAEGLLHLKGSPNCGGSGFLSAQTLTEEQTGDTFPAVRFTTAGAPAGTPLMSNTDFDYVIPDPGGNADKDQHYSGGGDIRVDVIQPWEVSFPDREIGADGAPGPLTCVITFPAVLSVEDGGMEPDLLQFHDLQAQVTSTSAAVTLTEETLADGTAIYTLTYGQDVTAIPPTQLSVSLTMTSRDHVLIPENEPQTHHLTLTVEAEETPPAPPEGQSLDAMPAAVPGEDKSVRRRQEQPRES